LKGDIELGRIRQWLVGGREVLGTAGFGAWASGVLVDDEAVVVAVRVQVVVILIIG